MTQEWHIEMEGKLEELWDSTPEGQALVSFEGTRLINGALEVIWEDDYSMVWLGKAVEKVGPLAGTIFKAVDTDQLVKWKKVPGPIKFDTRTLFERLERVNPGLKTTLWRPYDSVTLLSGTRFVIKVDEASAGTIACPGFRNSIGLHKAIFSFIGKPGVEAESEEPGESTKVMGEEVSKPPAQQGLNWSPGRNPLKRNNVREEVIDITLCTSNVVHKIKGWRVSGETSLSDHCHILFMLSEEARQAVAYRDPKATNWDLYRSELKRDIEGIAQHKFWNQDEIEASVTFLHRSIISSYEKSCPLKVKKEGQQLSWWGAEIEEAILLFMSLAAHESTQGHLQYPNRGEDKHHEETHNSYAPQYGALYLIFLFYKAVIPSSQGRAKAASQHNISQNNKYSTTSVLTHGSSKNQNTWVSQFFAKASHGWRAQYSCYCTNHQADSIQRNLFNAHYFPWKNYNEQSTRHHLPSTQKSAFQKKLGH
ncbi:hypothetical protein J437_LFUL009431 [Ladona fulva]|uniref:DUF4780 domain-containing protein n=1 Tax=Ladona fulva TaxID=123851 RepID=A0A8K0JY31_LADFU|nr:hypothetical protein J437_LFUL009431 [Ladona fulva]